LHIMAGIHRQAKKKSHHMVTLSYQAVE